MIDTKPKVIGMVYHMLFGDALLTFKQTKMLFVKTTNDNNKFEILLLIDESKNTKIAIGNRAKMKNINPNFLFCVMFLVNYIC